MNKTHLVIACALGLGATVAVSCVSTTRVLDPTHCSGAQDGDTFCLEQHPDGSVPYCRLGSNECNPDADFDIDGCFAERPENECYSPCGRDNTIEEDASCVEDTVGEESSTTTDGGSSTTSAETGSSSSSTTGPECTENAECTDPAAPFCVEEACAPCSASVAPTPDEACAELDPSMPLCEGDRCVQCTSSDASACMGTTPLCDAESNACVACQFHEECQDIGSPACNFATGACFDPKTAVMVDASDNGAVASAVAAVPDGEERAIVLEGGGGNNTITIDGGKTIAIVSDGSTVREVRGNGGAPTITVSGTDSIAYLHRLRVTLNGDDVGVAVTSSGTLYADSTQVVQNNGGGITLGSGTTGRLRNCMVGGAIDVAAIDASSSELSLLYTSVLGSLGDADGLTCTSGVSVSVRNSIITTRGDNPALTCSGTSVSSSSVEDDADTAWFNDYNSGDATLTGAGQAQFADIAIWEVGDPPFDFEGDARPNTDGADDFPGADVP